MELRHEQGVSVPEFCFYKRTVKFLETKRTKLVFYRFKELNIRICASRNNACRLKGNVIATECAFFPFSACEHFRGYFTNFVTSYAGFLQCFLYGCTVCSKLVSNCFSFNHFKWTVCCAAFFCKRSNNILFFFRKTCIVKKTVFCRGSFLQKLYSYRNSCRNFSTSIRNLFFFVHLKNAFFYQRSVSTSDCAVVNFKGSSNFWKCPCSSVFKQVDYTFFNGSRFCKSTTHICKFKICVRCPADFLKKSLTVKPREGLICMTFLIIQLLDQFFRCK